MFFISAILRASCNEIESSIINRGMCLVAARVNKGEISTQNEKIVETGMNVWY